MGIKGFQGTSLLDFPGRIAALVFFGGCNLSCPFCHNPSLVLDPESYPDIDEETLLAELHRRRPFIDAVVISGGEPTLDPGLPVLLERVKALGLAVKLDTNGLRPEVLQTVLERQLVDYLALDLKTAPERYGELHSGPVSPDALERSVRLLLAAGVDHEFRTTCVPGYVGSEEIRRLGRSIQGGRRWVLQHFLPRYALAPSLREAEPLAAGEMEHLRRLAGEFVEDVGVRGG